MKIETHVVRREPSPFGRDRRWSRGYLVPVLCCVSMLVSCGDNVLTSPAEPAISSQAGPLGAARSEGERITVTRTADVDRPEVRTGHPAGRPAHGRHWVHVTELSESLVAALPGAMPAPGTSVSPARLGDSTRRAPSAEDAARAMPLPELTVPVRRGSDPLSRTAWTRRRSSEVEGVTVEMSGVGDAPASRVVMSKDGRELATIRRTWRRRGRSWLLERQETTMPGSRFHEVVDIKRTGTPVEASAALARLLTLQSMVGPRGASAGKLDPFGATFDLIDCSGYDGSDQCATERVALERANEAVDDAGIALAIACVIPEPFEVAACQAAMAWLVSRIVKQENAKLALKRCEEKAAQKARCCTAASRLPEAGGSLMSRLQAPGGSSPDLAGCQDGDASAGGGNPGDPGAGGGILVICYYWVVYDRDTGEVLRVRLDHCESFMI